MRGKRNPWILVILLLFGALVGGLVGEALSGYEYLKWMSFGGTDGYRNLFAFSLDPLIDTRVLKLGINMALRVNAGSILGMLAGLLVFSRL